MKVEKTRAAFLLTGVATLTAACGILPGNSLKFDISNQGSSLDPTAQFQILDPALNQRALTLIQNQCASCHSPSGSAAATRFSDATTTAAMIASGMIIPGDSTNSPIVFQTQNGFMPLGLSLSAADKKTLSDWVTSGLSGSTPVIQPTSIPVTQPTSQPTASPSPQPTASPSPQPTAPAPAQPSALAVKAYNILRNNCTSCHNTSAQPHGIGDVSNFTSVVNNGWAVPGNAGSSPISIQILAGNMPPIANGLSQADRTTIQSWINTDLKAGGPQPQ